MVLSFPRVGVDPGLSPQLVSSRRSRPDGGQGCRRSWGVLEADQLPRSPHLSDHTLGLLSGPRLPQPTSAVGLGQVAWLF